VVPERFARVLADGVIGALPALRPLVRVRVAGEHAHDDVRVVLHASPDPAALRVGDGLHALVIEPRPGFAFVDAGALRGVALAPRRRIVAVIGVAADLGMDARSACVAAVVDVAVARVEVALVPVRGADLPRALVDATAR
jgi:hypothetical protein